MFKNSVPSYRQLLDIPGGADFFFNISFGGDFFVFFLRKHISLCSSEFQLSYGANPMLIGLSKLFLLAAEVKIVPS